MSTIRRETREHLTILRFDKSSGNAIDPAFVEDLISATAEVSKDQSVRGVLLATANPKLFCPGLDLVTLSELDRDGMGAFMRRFSEAVLGLFALRKPVVAAVAGHAIAGGCVIALTADERVLRKGSQIGLNEVKVGVPLPWSVALLLKTVVAPGALTRVALLGNNFTDEKARELGLADEVAEGEACEIRALARLSELAERDAYSFGVTKAYLRKDALAAMRANDEDLLPEFLDGWFSESTRERVKRTVEGMKNRS